jgi:hypothetical protein
MDAGTSGEPCGWLNAAAVTLQAHAARSAPAMARQSRAIGLSYPSETKGCRPGAATTSVWPFA